MQLVYWVLGVVLGIVVLFVHHSLKVLISLSFLFCLLALISPGYTNYMFSEGDSAFQVLWGIRFWVHQ